MNPAAYFVAFGLFVGALALWLMRCALHIVTFIIELLGLLCLPLGDSGPRFVCWLHGWLDSEGDDA